MGIILLREGQVTLNNSQKTALSEHHINLRVGTDSKVGEMWCREQSFSLSCASMAMENTGIITIPLEG